MTDSSPKLAIAAAGIGVTPTVRRGGKLYAMFGRRAPGIETWLSTAAVSRGVSLVSVFPDLFRSDLYVCGPTPWAMLVVRDARTAGLREERIHLERFDW